MQQQKQTIQIIKQYERLMAVLALLKGLVPSRVFFVFDIGYNSQSGRGSMNDRNPFVEQSREQVVKSMVNWSHSKQLWTFPKKRRFHAPKPECPHTFYQKDVSELSNIKIKFTSSTRKLFTENDQSPSPAQYFPQGQKPTKGLSFGLSREKVKFSSYVKHQLANVPGPNKYDKFASDEEQKAKRGYSIRPKTANDRNYFIQNKELEGVPSPSNYEFDAINLGGCKIAKFRSVTLGGVGLMKKSKRFQAISKTPGPSSYEPKKKTKSSSIGGRIGSSLRTSFIDKINISTASPGPGDYQIPSQFGHYKKVDIRSRLVTIQ